MYLSCSVWNCRKGEDEAVGRLRISLLVPGAEREKEGEGEAHLFCAVLADNLESRPSRRPDLRLDLVARGRDHLGQLLLVLVRRSADDNLDLARVDPVGTHPSEVGLVDGVLDRFRVLRGRCRRTSERQPESDREATCAEWIEAHLLVKDVDD